MLNVTEDSITLTSPNGKNKITLKAGDDIAAIWLTSADRKESVAIFLNNQGAAVGTYDEGGPGNNFSGVGSYGEGGALQLTLEGEVSRFTANDLKAAK